ncbi:MAG: hypothetical protein ACYCS1_05940 [Gammaproteobacteria bacterium]
MDPALDSLLEVIHLRLREALRDEAAFEPGQHVRFDEPGREVRKEPVDVLDAALDVACSTVLPEDRAVARVEIGAFEQLRDGIGDVPGELPFRGVQPRKSPGFQCPAELYTSEAFNFRQHHAALFALDP